MLFGEGYQRQPLHRTLGITLKSAWFVGHRIREAMRSGELKPMGGLETHVEADETFIGRLEGQPKAKAGAAHKNVVLRGIVHSNTVEGFYSIFKRGKKGVYQHCSERQLHRYLAEFDFRYSNRIALDVTILPALTARSVVSQESVSPIERLTNGSYPYGRKAKVKATEDD